MLCRSLSRFQSKLDFLRILKITPKAISSLNINDTHVHVHVHVTPPTYRVTPDAHISALNPDQLSCPDAISGDWKAGLPWKLQHLSD